MSAESPTEEAWWNEAEPTEVEWVEYFFCLLHPTQTIIVEAMRALGRPLSAINVTHMIDSKKVTVSHVSYHVVLLAKQGLIEPVRGEPCGGSSRETLYFWSGSMVKALTREQTVEVLADADTRHGLFHSKAQFLELTGLDPAQFEHYLAALSSIEKFGRGGERQRTLATRWLIRVGFHLGEVLAEIPGGTGDVVWPESLDVRCGPGGRRLVLAPGVPVSDAADVRRYLLQNK